MRFRAAATSVIAVAVALFLPCAAPLRGQELTTIRIAAPPTDDYKVVMYGLRSGLFKRYGLDVQPQLVNSGAAAVAAIVGGSAEVAFTGVPAVLQAYLRGVIDFRSTLPNAAVAGVISNRWGRARS